MDEQAVQREKNQILTDLAFFPLYCLGGVSVRTHFGQSVVQWHLMDIIATYSYLHFGLETTQSQPWLLSKAHCDAYFDSIYGIREGDTLFLVL